MDNTEYLTQITNLQKEQEKAALEAAKTKALTSLEQEQAKQAPIYQGQREQVNVASQIGAKNFAEYMAQRGQTNAGLSAQAEMSRQNVLGRTIGDINKQETQGIQDYQNQRANVETDFNTNLAGAMSKADIGLRENLYNERIRQQENTQALALARASSRGTTTTSSPQTAEGSVKTVNGVTQQYINGKWSKIEYAKDAIGDVINKKEYEWNKKGYGNTGQASPITFKDEKGNTFNYKIWVKDNIPNIIVRGNPIPLVVDRQNGAALTDYIIELGRTGKLTPQQMVELNNTIEIIE